MVRGGEGVKMNKAEVQTFRLKETETALCGESLKRAEEKKKVAFENWCLKRNNS